jgi:hypothetical protein
MGDGGPGTGDRKVTAWAVDRKRKSGSRLYRTALLVIAMACVALGVGFGFVGMATARQSGRSNTPRAVKSHPKRAWWASKPPGTPLGLRHGFYTTVAASGNVMVGITFASPEGSLLVRFDPTDGKLLWIARLPTYAEHNALAIREGRILVLAPGKKLRASGAEGEGPAEAFAFSLKGAELWRHSLHLADAAFGTGEWATPTLPRGDESRSFVLTDFDAIPDFTILYGGKRLRGIDDADGHEWRYRPDRRPSAITGPGPGESDDLHVVDGLGQLLIDGQTGEQVERNRSTPRGRGLGLVGPLFHPRAAEPEPRIRGIGYVTPLPAFARHVVYGAVGRSLVAIDTRDSRKLWSLPENGPYGIETAVAGPGFVLASGDEGTFLVREGKRH